MLADGLQLVGSVRARLLADALRTEAQGEAGTDATTGATPSTAGWCWRATRC